MNCIDRHLGSRGDQTVIIWEGDDPTQSKHTAFNRLHGEVCRFAYVRKASGIKKGDVISIYMPMIPEAAYAMLACKPIGAIHSIVFGGFSAEALAGRITDARSKVEITADEGLRGGCKVPLKTNVDVATKKVSDIEVTRVIVVRRTGAEVLMKEGRDVLYDEVCNDVVVDCPYEEMGVEDPLIILHTSRSTGRPNGVLHTTGGYLVYSAITHKYVFDYHDGDIYWCTADVGWVTGYSYVIHGPLATGATTLMFEGVANYPDCSRFWQIVDKHGVKFFFTPCRPQFAPICKRVMSPATSRASLRILGAVGEPINPEAWEWYYYVVCDERCPIVDTWRQTETGGIIITPFPGATDLKPDSAAWPFFGTQLQIVNNKGNVLEGACEGTLCIINSWPGQMRTVYGYHERF